MAPTVPGSLADNAPKRPQKHESFYVWGVKFLERAANDGFHDEGSKYCTRSTLWRLPRVLDSFFQGRPSRNQAKPETWKPYVLAMRFEVVLVSGKSALIETEPTASVDALRHLGQSALLVHRGELLRSSGKALEGWSGRMIVAVPSPSCTVPSRVAIMTS